jgi:uncharacterized OsmC-like protein
MTTHLPRRWSVNAVSEGSHPLRLFCDGRPLTQSAPSLIDDVSPVEYLLIAVASCFALSCRAVLNKHKAPKTTFEVVATGEKSAGRNQLANIAVVAIFRDGIDEAQGTAIADEAEPLCTVSNTLLGSPRIDYGVRAIKDAHATAYDDVTRLANH